MIHHTVRAGRIVVGCLLLLAGFVMALPLVPGPGILVMVGGLALLGHEFEWARRLRTRLHTTARRLTGSENV